MDISTTSLRMPQTAAISRLLDQVITGHDLHLPLAGDDAQAVLDQLADGLIAMRSRVLRVAASSPGGLSLSRFMAQVAGEPDLAAQDDKVLELGFRALTVLDGTCDRIVLLVSDAHALQRPTLRYIQFASRATGKLQIVFAGTAEFIDLLGSGEFGSLQARLDASSGIASTLAIPVMVDATLPMNPAHQELRATHRPQASRPAGAASPPPAAARPRNGLAWTAAGIGMAASIAIGIVIGRYGWQAAPALQAGLIASAELAAAAVTKPYPPDDAASGVPAAAAYAPGAPTPGSVASASPMAAGLTADAATPFGSQSGPARGNQATGDIATSAPVLRDAPGVVPPVEATRAQGPIAGKEQSPVASPATSDAIAVSQRPATPAPSVSKQAEGSRVGAQEAPASSVARKVTSKPPRPVARPLVAPGRRAVDPDGLDADPPVGWHAPLAGSDTWSQAARPADTYIGTYTPEVNGVRTFRFGP